MKILWSDMKSRIVAKIKLRSYTNKIKAFNDNADVEVAATSSDTIHQLVASPLSF